MVADPTDWCYPSGIVAVLETFLLAPRAVNELAEAGSPDELVSRARRSPVYADLHVLESEDPMQVAAAFEAALAEFVGSFARQCPDERIADLFLIEYDIRDLANYLKSEHCGVERRPVAMSRLPADGIKEFLAESPRLGRIAGDVARAAETGDGALDASTVDLMIDGAFIGMLPELAEPLGSPLVDEWASERQRLAAVEAVARAKAAGVDAAPIREHLLARLPPDGDAAALAGVELEDLGTAMSDLLPPEIVEGFDPSAGASSLQTLATRIDAALERILEPSRFVAFGAERVFGYLWRLSRENRNLRAALGGFAGRIEPELVALSLRGL
ncbi:MAG: V-type ATPase subunit [Planctomycetota bacterium]